MGRSLPGSVFRQRSLSDTLSYRVFVDSPRAVECGAVAKKRSKPSTLDQHITLVCCLFSCLLAPSVF